MKTRFQILFGIFLATLYITTYICFQKGSPYDGTGVLFYLFGEVLTFVLVIELASRKKS